MNKELTQKIKDIAPWMFTYPGSDDIRQSLMPFGFEIGDGWYKLMYDLVEGLAKIDTEKSIKVFQIKEKFGGLRFYYNGGPGREADDLVDIAEDRSFHTCEECGEPGKEVNPTGWIYVRCEKCVEEMRKSREI
jgi:hypothetical protein